MTAARPRVLLVEDNPDDVFLFRKAMEREGLTHPVQVVHDGASALAALAEPASTDLVLLDLNLPGLSGFDVLRQLGRDAPCDVVVMTSSTSPLEVREAQELGASAYVVKPYRLSDVCSLIRTLLEGWPTFEGLQRFPDT